MRYTVFGQLEGEESSLTWENGRLSGDPTAVALLKGAAKGAEGDYVGPPAGPYTTSNHLRDPLSTYHLIMGDVFKIERHEGDNIPCPPEIVKMGDNGVQQPNKALSSLVTKCMQGENYGKPGPCPSAIDTQSSRPETTLGQPSQVKVDLRNTPEGNAVETLSRDNRHGYVKEVLEDWADQILIRKALAGRGSEAYKRMQQAALENQKNFIEKGSESQKKTAIIAKIWTHSEGGGDEGIEAKKAMATNKDMIDHIRAVSTRTGVDLYRGIDTTNLSSDVAQKFLSSKPGDLLPEMHIASFTEKRGWAGNFVTRGFFVKLPAGNGRSLNLQSVSNSIGECEHVVSGSYRVKTVTKQIRHFHAKNKKGYRAQEIPCIEIEEVR